MAPRQKVPYALVDVVVDSPIGQQPGPVTEVRRPPSQSLIESIADLFPSPDIARPQEISHLLLNSLHTLLRRTRSQIPVTIFPIVLRAERIPEKVKPLCTSFPDLRFRFVQSEANPSHDAPRPFQCLSRMSATEDHEIIRVIHHSGLKYFTPPGHPPVLQKTVHVQVREHGTGDSPNAKDNLRWKAYSRAREPVPTNCLILPRSTELESNVES